MKKWTNTAICHEIRRQSRWRLSKIESLTEEREEAKADKARLLKRRASYQAKNNGKGRPPKPLPEFPRKKGTQILRFKLEVPLLEELLLKLKVAKGRKAPDALEVLKVQAELEKAKPLDTFETSKLGDVPQLVRLAKLQNLIDLFGKPPASPLSSPQAWDERLARQYFKMMRERQLSRCRLFDRVATPTGVERVEEERERAKLSLLERTNFSNHLGSPSDFASAVRFWRDDVPLAKPHNTKAWPALWREGTEEFWRETAAIFDLSSVSL